MTFAGYKLRNLREAKGWDQKTLAARAGLGTTVISYLESGKTVSPKSATVNALAGALDVHPGALLKRTRIVPATETVTAAAPGPEAAAPLPLFDAPTPPAPLRRPPTDQEWDMLPGRWRRLFTACMREGFTEPQAMQLLMATTAWR